MPHPRTLAAAGLSVLVLTLAAGCDRRGTPNGVPGTPSTTPTPETTPPMPTASAASQ